MNDKLTESLAALKALDRDALSPVAFANLRERALIQGLQGLAEAYGKMLAPTRIDGNGELDFNIVGDQPGVPGACGQYGPELAAWLSHIPRRTGIMPTTAPVLPQNGWCRIHHFNAERLLLRVAEAMPAPEPDGAAPALGANISEMPPSRRC